MTYVPVARRVDFTPSRSVAMAMALALNLALVLMAMRPHTPFTLHAPPPPEALLATLVRKAPPPPAMPLPPTVRVAQHVTPEHVAVTYKPPVDIRTAVSTEIAPIHIDTPAHDASASTGGGAVAAANTDATIAYETATPPPYPLSAIRAGVQGTVLLKVLVDTQGKPVQVVIAHGSGSHVLDIAARKHVLAAWRFHPAVRDGHAIEAWVLVPVRFDLQDR